MNFRIPTCIRTNSIFKTIFLFIPRFEYPHHRHLFSLHFIHVCRVVDDVVLVVVGGVSVSTFYTRVSVTLCIYCLVFIAAVDVVVVIVVSVLLLPVVLSFFCCCCCVCVRNVFFELLEHQPLYEHISVVFVCSQCSA